MFRYYHANLSAHKIREKNIFGKLLEVPDGSRIANCKNADVLSVIAEHIYWVLSKISYLLFLIIPAPGTPSILDFKQSRKNPDDICKIVKLKKSAAKNNVLR